MLSTRILTQTPAALAIAASIVSGVLCGATDAAYAVHGHRAGAHSSSSHTGRQFPAHLRCILCAEREPVLP